MSQIIILTVCTGNVCRSPLAEAMLRQAFAEYPMTVHSAGTRALVGCKMPKQQLEIAKALGIVDPETHTAKQLTLEHVESADLILAMGREHRSATVELTPKALRKTFTLRELARIVEVVPDEDLVTEGARGPKNKWRAAVEAAALNRGIVPPAESPDDNDVIDPFRRSQETYLTSRDQLIVAIHNVTQYLTRAIT